MEMSRTQAEAREPASAPMPEFVSINPPSLLIFDGHGMVSRTITTTLLIENISDNVVIYKIKTTRPKAYCVRPNSGHLSPSESIEVEVTLQSFDNVEQDLPKHKFQVQAACVDAIPENVTAKWAEIDKNKNSTPVQDTKLKCALKNILTGPLSTRPVTLGLHQAEPVSVQELGAAATTQRRQEANARKTSPAEAPTPVKAAVRSEEETAKTTTTQVEQPRQAQKPPTTSTSSTPSSSVSSSVATKTPTPSTATAQGSSAQTTHEDVAGKKGNQASLLLLLVAFILGVMIGRFVL